MLPSKKIFFLIIFFKRLFLALLVSYWRINMYIIRLTKSENNTACESVTLQHLCVWGWGGGGRVGMDVNTVMCIASLVLDKLCVAENHDLLSCTRNCCLGKCQS